MSSAVTVAVLFNADSTVLMTAASNPAASNPFIPAGSSPYHDEKGVVGRSDSIEKDVAKDTGKDHEEKRQNLEASGENGAELAMVQVFGSK